MSSQTIASWARALPRQQASMEAGVKSQNKRSLNSKGMWQRDENDEGTRAGHADKNIQEGKRRWKTGSLLRGYWPSPWVGKSSTARQAPIPTEIILLSSVIMEDNTASPRSCTGCTCPAGDQELYENTNSSSQNINLTQSFMQKYVLVDTFKTFNIKPKNFLWQTLLTSQRFR